MLQRKGRQWLASSLSSTLSGTVTSAEAAAERFDAAPLRVVDSLGASLLLGLLVLKASELAEAGRFSRRDRPGARTHPDSLGYSLHGAVVRAPDRVWSGWSG